MGRNAFFVQSQYPPGADTVCAKCDLFIKDVQDGAVFWNPNPRAIDRLICRNCYEVWQFERKRKAELWKLKHQAVVQYEEMDREDRDADI